MDVFVLSYLCECMYVCYVWIIACCFYVGVFVLRMCVDVNVLCVWVYMCYVCVRCIRAVCMSVKCACKHLHMFEHSVAHIHLARQRTFMKAYNKTIKTSNSAPK